MAMLSPHRDRIARPNPIPIDSEHHEIEIQTIELHVVLAFRDDIEDPSPEVVVGDIRGHETWVGVRAERAAETVSRGV